MLLLTPPLRDIPLSERSILLIDEPHCFKCCIILLPSVALEIQVLNSVIFL